MRILGIRHLPDDFDITSVQLSPDQEPIKGRLGGGLREEPGQDPGRWINVEAQFSYRKLPPPHSQANQMHMVIHMGFGVRKIIKFEVSNVTQRSQFYTADSPVSPRAGPYLGGAARSTWENQTEVGHAKSLCWREG